MNIPSIVEIYNNIFEDMQSQLGSDSSYLDKLFVRATCSVLAAKFYLLYLSIAKIDKNVFIDTAEPESQGGTLERFGRAKLGRNPRQAQAAEYTALVTGEVGAEISASTSFKSDDNSKNAGNVFVVDQSFIFTSATGFITLRALDAGMDSELSINDTLTATAPILNVSQSAKVTAEVIAPLAEETVEDYRSAGLQAFQLEPQGGSASDYILWANDATGVAAVYPYASGTSSNSIDLFVESNTGNGTAPQSVLNEVAAVTEQDPDATKQLNERGRRPLGVLQIFTKSVTIGILDLTIVGLSTNTVDVQNTIKAALEAELSAVRPFIASANSIESKNDVLTGGKLTSIIQASIGSSNYFNGLTWLINGFQVTSAYTFTDGQIPELGTVTFIN